MPEPRRLSDFSPSWEQTIYREELERRAGIPITRSERLGEPVLKKQPPKEAIPTWKQDIYKEEIERRRATAPPATKERGALGEFAAGFGRGVLGVVAAPAEIADVAGEAIGWEALEKAGEAGVKAVEKYIEESPKLKRTESISKNILKNPELWKDPRWYSSIVGEGLPTILSMVVPGMAAAKAAKVAKLGAKGVRAARIAGGLSAGVGLEAAGAASDIRHHEEQTGEAIPISTKLQSVLGTGIVAGSLEYVPIFAIFGKAGAKKLVGRVLSGMAMEGTTEGAQGLVANAFAKAGYDADRNMVDGVVESIVGGVLLGGGMGAVSRVTNFKERVDETNPDEVSDILEQAEKETKVTPERAVELTEAEKRQAAIDREFEARRTPAERQAEIEVAMPATPMTTISEETTKLAEEGIVPAEVIEPIPEEIVPEEIPLVPEAMPATLRAMGMKPVPVEPIVEKPIIEEKIVEPKAPKIEIPTLTDTTQAIAFGEKATPEQITELKRLRKESETRYIERRKKQLQDLIERAKPIPEVAPKEAMTYEKGITLKRAQEITGDKSPSVSQIRDAFDKRAEAEAKEKPIEPKVEKPKVAEKELSTEIEKRGIKGNDLLDALDRIEEAKSYDKTIEIDKTGHVTLYHRTDKASAENITKSGYMTTKEPGLFFGSKPEGQISGYGDTVIEVQIPIEKLELNDVFTDEVHFRLPEAMPKGKYKVEVIKKPAKPPTPKPPKPKPPEAVREEIEAKPIPEVAPKEAMTYEKGITLKRAQEITGDKSPSVSQIRDAFDKRAEAEQKSVINNVKHELKEVETEKKEILKSRKEAFVPDKPIYTERLKTANKEIERRKKQLQDLIERAEPIPEVAPKKALPKKEPKVEAPVEKEPWEMTQKEALEAIRQKGKKIPLKPSLISIGKGILTEGMTISGIPAREIPGWENALKQHRIEVKQAIEKGKIESHPDYPDLAKPMVPKPTVRKPSIKPVVEKKQKAIEPTAATVPEQIKKEPTKAKPFEPDLKTLPLGDINVKVKAIKESTGEIITIDENAKVAIELNEKEMEKFYELLACL